MQKFGNSDTFAIWVDYYIVRYKDDPQYIEYGPTYKSGGHVYFWVNGKNLFERNEGESYHTFSGDVDVLATFFCDYLYYHITDDPFPIKTAAKNGWDMMYETRFFDEPDDDVQKYAEIDWSKVDMEERKRIYSWNVKHGLLTNDGGFFLPDGYLRKVGQNVEYSWKSSFPRIVDEDRFSYKYTSGVEIIDIKIYRDTIVAFCKDYIERFKDIYPLLREREIELQKAIDVKL